MSRSGQKSTPNYRVSAILIVVLSAIVVSMIPSETLSQTRHEVFRFDIGKLELGKTNSYDVVRYPPLDITYETGMPQLPVKLVHIQLPPGKTIVSVKIIRVESRDLDGEFTPFPCQKPQPLSKKAVAFADVDPVVYSRMEPYPVEIAEISGAGFSSGFGVGALVIHPVRYFPAEKKLTFYSLVEVEIIFDDTAKRPAGFVLGDYADLFHRKTLESITVGPVDTKRIVDGPSRASSTLPDEEHLYVIVTDASLVTAFEPLARWKLLKGLSSEIVTVQYITANYTGLDVQDQIRNFIKDAYATWGTVWVLLGGDTNIIPPRLTYAMDAEWGPSYNEIPCDLYYADLDGDWNANGNATYGEVADDVDMYPDVFVGRAPVENATEAANWVGKMNTYEKQPACGHELDMLFIATILWDVPYTDSGEAKNHIDELYVPDRFDPITKLYESLGNGNRTTAINALNAGPNIINHDGHANYTVMGVGHNEYLSRSDMDLLTNDERPSVLYSIGCLPAAIDEDCIAEHFLTNAGGGGVAFVGNSRFGWGSPGNPLYGYSDRFDQQFFRMLFDEDIEHIGQTLAAAKSQYVPFARQANVYRWCEFEINLLGDPEMPVWTDTPDEMLVACPTVLPLGATLCPVTVTRTSDGSPVEGARVCVLDDAGVYETGVTGIDGRVQFEFTTTNPAATLLVTVTAKNTIPNVTLVSLQSNEPFVQIASYSTNGSGDGFVIPGAAVSMDACFKNYGAEPAAGVTAVLRTQSPYITLTDSTVSLGTIPAGDSVSVTGAFAFDVGAGIENGDVVLLETEVSDAAAGLWAGEVGVTGATSVFVRAGHDLLDTAGGDGDGFIDPGETADLNVYIKNIGFDPGSDVTVAFSTASSYVSFTGGPVVCGAVEPGETRCAHTGLVVDPACPVPMVAQIDIQIDTGGGQQFNDVLTVAIGEHGFLDDMEAGDGAWVHNGTADLWHRSSHRYHSGVSSWYNGVEGLFEYGIAMEDTLLTGPFVIGDNTELSFWCWYECATYGSDGVYVEVSDDGMVWATLDFLGSGGALGRLVVGNDWLEYSYGLPGYVAGSNLWLRFRFHSDDADVAEGIYIDDVCVGSKPIEIVTGIDPRVETGGWINRLEPNYPNPFNPETTIRFTLDRPHAARLEIFDVNGSRVRLLYEGRGIQGINTVVWDGKNDSGATVSTGVYFYRIVAGDFIGTRKMILLR